MRLKYEHKGIFKSEDMKEKPNRKMERATGGGSRG